MVWDVLGTFFEEGISRGMNCRPPRAERGRIAEEVFFAVEVCGGEEVRLGSGSGDGESERKLGGERLDGGHRR